MRCNSCRICGNVEDNRSYTCTEKMFGMGGQFPYFQCAACGCLQIAEVPVDIARYYPKNYYSFHLQAANREGWRSKLAASRDLACLTGQRWFWSWLPNGKALRVDVRSLGRVPLRPEMKVLDVGCGSGQLLSVLHRAGFRHLAGLDPFIPSDLEAAPGVMVRKQTLEECAEQFDLIMLHHVFEHVEDGKKTLTAGRERLRAGGKIVLRVPTVDSEAWERYRENWVSLDPPRHFFLHSRKSLKLVAEQAGLAVERTWCDSTTFQFSGSEVYQAGGTLFDASGNYVPLEKRFSEEKFKEFEREAERVNAADRGDEMAAVLIVNKKE